MLVALINTPDVADVMFLGTADEEVTFSGVRKFAQANNLSISGAIVGEPTEGIPAVCHKGVLRRRITTLGKAAHGAMPELGENAIEMMCEVVKRLKSYKLALAERPPHAKLGLPTINIGKIFGGHAANIVPDRCTIELDRRMVPGETERSVISELDDLLSDLSNVEEASPFMSSPAFEIEPDHPWVCRVVQATGAGETRSLHYATDAAYLAQAGVPCVVLGPGNPEQAHRADESISVESVRDAVKQYEAILRYGR
jgi:acetylornithine deacetylase